MEDLQKIMNTDFHMPLRNLVRDLFVFSSFTGMAYADVKKLTVNELATTDDGRQWIIAARKKTGTVSRIRLLDTPLKIIEKHIDNRTDDRLFHVPVYGTVDHNLKRIDKICGINRQMTFHMARHTFATAVCLSQGVPIETVSKMLGHRDIQTTQIYATVSTQKISSDMEKLSKRIAGRFCLAKNLKIKKI
jgi:integrase